MVVPGGVSALPLLRPAQILAEAGKLHKAVTADTAAVMATSSFLDRLRRHRTANAGTHPPARGARPDREGGRVHADDTRLHAPLRRVSVAGRTTCPSHTAGDALARLRVRWEEVDQAFGLIRQAGGRSFGRTGRRSARVPCKPTSGRAVGWAEAPQGEVLYDVLLREGRIVYCHPRSASFHNLVLMHEVFTGDILTDFPFIEASFGLSVAGVAL